MNINSVEIAYERIANYLTAFIGHRFWDSATCHFRVLAKMARGTQWLVHNGVEERKGDFEGSSEAIWDGLDAALFLRDDLLRTTGQRIWGLTFTLFPDGQFKIEYDYNKPEGYEESDEVITGDEINASLAKLTGQDSKPS
jgi:hypothetical protein